MTLPSRPSSCDSRSTDMDSAASREPAGNRAETRQLQVSGMSCQGCVGRMRRAVEAGDEGAEVSGDPASAKLTVTSRLPLDDILQRLDEAGYPAQPMPGRIHGGRVRKHRDEPVRGLRIIPWRNVDSRARAIRLFSGGVLGRWCEQGHSPGHSRNDLRQAVSLAFKRLWRIPPVSNRQTSTLPLIQHGCGAASIPRHWCKRSSRWDMAPRPLSTCARRKSSEHSATSGTTGACSRAASPPWGSPSP